MWYVLVGALSLAVGFLIGYFTKKKRITVGTLRMDFTDPLKDKYLIEFDRPPEFFSGREEVILKIDAKHESR